MSAVALCYVFNMERMDKLWDMLVQHVQYCSCESSYSPLYFTTLSTTGLCDVVQPDENFLLS